MDIRRSIHRLPLCLLLGIGFGLQSIAQEESDNSVFELSPFVVESEDDQGWTASTTLIGTRTRQAIQDMPISIDAVTVEFLDDIGAYDLEDASIFIAGLDTAPQLDNRNDDGRTSFRGLELGNRENGASSRNFFTWYPRTETYNVERIDFNKGSNSLMFGDTAPGGLATTYTKRARDRNFGQIRASFGSDDSYRMQLDVNQKISDKLFLRLNMIERNRKGYVDYAEDYVFGYHIAATWRPLQNTEIRAEYEKLEYERNRGRTDIQINQRAALGRGFSGSRRDWYTSDGDLYHWDSRLYYESDGQGGFLEPYTIASNDRRNGATGDDLSLAKGFVQNVRDRSTGDVIYSIGPMPITINTYGVRDFVDRPIDNYTVWVEQRLGDLFLEFAANRQEQSQQRNDNSFGNTLNMDSDGRLYLDSNIDRKEFGNDVNNLRFTAAYPLETKWFEQYIVATASYMDDLAYSFRERLVNKAKALDPSTGEYDVSTDLEREHRIRIRGYFDADDPVADLTNPATYDVLVPENIPNVPGLLEPMWVLYTTPNKPFNDKRYTRSASISSSGSYFGGRLISLIGVRWDGFQLKRYTLPNGMAVDGDIDDLIADYGELAWWGQHPYLGTPDEAPEAYAYLPEFDVSDTTYSVGLSWAVLDNMNIYGNYSTSFRWQGTENFLGELLGPQEGITYEVGVKGDFLDKQIIATAAVFQVDRENVAFRFDTGNNSDELEMLFNDGTINIDPDGTMTYEMAAPGSPGFVEIARGLNQERRQVTSSETSEGFEFTLSTQRINGFRARVGVSYIDISSLRDLTKYAALVEIAEQRAAERAPIIAANWPNDPLYDPNELPPFEEDLREYLEDAQNVVASNTGPGLITGSRARPWRFSYVLEYQFSQDSFLDGLRVIYDGKWSEDYLLSTNDSVLWYGGATHPVNLTFIYETELFGYDTSFSLRIRDLHDWENPDGYKPHNGFVDQFTGEETWRYRNIYPTTWEFTASVKF